MSVLVDVWRAPTFWMGRQSADSTSPLSPGEMPCLRETDADYARRARESCALLTDLAQARWWARRPPYLRSRGEYERAEAAYPVSESERRVAPRDLPMPPQEEAALPEDVVKWVRVLDGPGAGDYFLSLTLLRDRMLSREFDEFESHERWYQEFDGVASATWQTDGTEFQCHFDRSDGDSMMLAARAYRMQAAATLEALPYPRALVLWALQVCPDGPVARVDSLCRVVQHYTDLFTSETINT